MRARRDIAVPFIVLLLTLCRTAFACWQEAAQRYQVPVELLVAIARAESSLDPRAINRSHLARTGSYDIGLMQINSTHLPRLARWGIGEAQLLDPCINLHVGAWILSQSIAKHGLTWEAVGAYNAACTRLRGPACRQARDRYIRAVARHLPSAGGRP